jgi:hypothetical protein
MVLTIQLRLGLQNPAAQQIQQHAWSTLQMRTCTQHEKTQQTMQLHAFGQQPENARATAAVDIDIMADVIKKMDHLRKDPVTPQPGDSHRRVCNMFSLRVQRPLCRKPNDITALYVRQP